MAKFNSRTVMAPMAAFTMACVLFVYTRSSIQTAKVNAKLSREAQLREQREARERENRG
ncbi:hypothetical protein QBC35DRAFT_497258 [Podospora australis]|uniref:Uncharacterized protein n=1 Tax=Podospora australis TaxID=1536484 RepID=A0AAN7AGS4_9PEZI|nr:hypothetical protein QBC35DRAFT_497258 [Podospora australis]